MVLSKLSPHLTLFQPWISRGKRGRKEKLGWQGSRLQACLVAWGWTCVNNQRTTPARELRFQSWEAFWSSLVGLNSPNILHPIPLPSVCVLSCFSRVRLFVTLWTVARQAALSTGYSRQEYWSGLPCPPPGDLPSPGIEPASLTSPALADRRFTTWEVFFDPLVEVLIYCFLKFIRYLFWASQRIVRDTKQKTQARLQYAYGITE